MHFEIIKFKEADIKKLSEIYFEWIQNTPFKDGSRTIEVIEAQFSKAAQNDDELVILAFDNSDDLVGWMNIFIGFPEMIFAGRWHPQVRPGDDESEIARSLLNEYKKYGIEIGRRRLEGQFDKITEPHQQLLEDYSRLYESQGFYRVTEEAYMELLVDEREELQLEVPNGFDLVPISAKTNDEIKESFFETFLGSKDGLFIDMDHEQQVVTFNYWFNRERKFIENAALLMLKENEVAGFIITRPHHNNASIGPIGVNPKYRRNGIAKVLVSTAIDASFSKGVEKIELEVATSNTLAYNLYKKFGFKTLHRTVFYAWVPERSDQ